MYGNLAVQGYCLGRPEASELRVGLRFSTGLCLPLVVTGLALESAPLLFALAVVAAMAGFTPRHPFDLVWNHGVRHLIGGAEVPANPARRRHAFKVGAAWLSALGVLFAVGQDAVGLGLGLALVAACGLVTATNFCVPSTVLALLERRFRAGPGESLAT